MGEYERKHGPSPIFSAQNSSSIAASAFWVYDFSEQVGASQKYLPFDNLVITNNSSQNLKFYPNQTSRFKLIAAGTIQIFDRNTIPALRSFKIENIGSASISANEIEVACQKEAIGGETFFQKVHRSFFGNKNVL